jgi:hypothetical protein
MRSHWITYHASQSACRSDGKIDGQVLATLLTQYLAKAGGHVSQLTYAYAHLLGTQVVEVAVRGKAGADAD